jgi:hypothetical protein
MWGLFVGAAAAVLAPIGPEALVPLKLAVASADSVGNDVYVAIVVDFGNGSSMSTVSKCVPVPSNARDSDALAAAVGSSNVAYASSGLLCAIDNYPANGVQNCGQSVGNGNYDYWSYWHGSSGSWVYASNGPTEQSVSGPANDVEGLRFQLDEPDTPSSPPPSLAPSYAQICNASTEVPPTPSSSNTPTTTLTTQPAPSLTPTTAPTSAGSAGTATTSPLPSTRSTSSGAAGAATTTTTTAPGKTTSTLASAATAGTVGASHGSSRAHRAAVASATSHQNSTAAASSDLLSVIVVAVIVAALGGFALLRWRRRPAEE